MDVRADVLAAFFGWPNDRRFGQKRRCFSVQQVAAVLAEVVADADNTPQLPYSPAPAFHLFLRLAIRLVCAMPLGVGTHWPSVPSGWRRKGR